MSAGHCSQQGKVAGLDSVKIKEHRSGQGEIHLKLKWQNHFDADSSMAIKHETLWTLKYFYLFFRFIWSQKSDKNNIYYLSVVPVSLSIFLSRGFHYYLSWGGCVFIPVCLLVSLFVCQQDYAKTSKWISTNTWKDRTWAKKEPIRLWHGSEQMGGSSNICYPFNIVGTHSHLCAMWWALAGSHSSCSNVTKS